MSLLDLKDIGKKMSFTMDKKDFRNTVKLSKKQIEDIQKLTKYGHYTKGSFNCVIKGVEYWLEITDKGVFCWLYDSGWDEGMPVPFEWLEPLGKILKK